MEKESALPAKGFRKKFVYQTFFMLLANLVVALAINLLAWQFKLVSGGLSGYSLLINYLTNIPTGAVLLGANVLILLLALLIAGKGPGIRGIIGFVSLSIFIDVTRFLLPISQTNIDSLTLNFVYILILSFIMGLGISTILANEYNVGAYSAVYLIVKKFVTVKPEVVFFAFDFLLAIISAVIYGWKIGLLLVVNAVFAFFVVKIAYPRLEKLFAHKDIEEKNLSETF